MNTTTTLLAAALLAVLITVGGCSKNGESRTLDVFPRSPEEVARDAFNTHDPDKRRNAVEQLAAAEFGGEPAYVKAYRLLTDDPDPTVRGAAVKALAQHGSLADVPTFTRLLSEDETPFVRWQSAIALQRMHDPEAVKPLTAAMLKDPDVDVRAAAAEALGQYPDHEVFSSLVAALDDMNFSVAAAAQQSLSTLTGYDFGTDGSLWLIWAKRTAPDLFEHQKTYTYRPYAAPESTMERLKFWSEPEQPEPRRPLGADQPTQTTRADG